MSLQTLSTKPPLPYAVSGRPLQTSGTDCDFDGVYDVRIWRCPAEDGNNRASGADILVSRWVDPRSSRHHESAVSSSERHVISVAVKTTRLKLTRGSHTIFDGTMPAGTVHVTGPSQPLTAESHAPCDFIHFHVSNEYLRKRQDAARPGLSQPIRDLNDLVIRDPLAELLGRTLIESGKTGDRLYAESVGQTLVMHIARLELPRPTVSALPKWRLKRVQEYVDAHLDEGISLADLAKVVGLSRMHFAAQFRAATGYRPHDYLLYQRIESAKTILSNTDMPLAEIALTVGFHAQAHFSTVFKRLTGETPARWRSSVKSDRPPETFGRPSTTRDQDRMAASI
jgi:AraC family transcriptional regulator